MKEIDLLPQWYKDSRRHRLSYRKQCMVLGAILLMMMLWNVSAVHRVSKVTASTRAVELKQVESENMRREFAQVRSQVTGFEKKQDVLEKISSKIDVAGVLGEISFLINEKIVLNRLDIRAEKFSGKGSATGAGGVRSASPGKGGALAGDVRYRILIRGIAAESSDVAELICRLEDSSYFCQVYPSFSRDKKITVDSEYQVSEFEIRCYLANYKFEKNKETGSGGR